MRILYYCPEYYFRHGGRTHARGFYNALGQLPSVSATFLYPRVGEQKSLQEGEVARPAKDKLWFIPETVRKVIRFFLPRSGLTTTIIDEITANRVDALIIRTGARMPSIARIRRACPGTSICLEVNSAQFDESFQDLPFRTFFQRWEVARFKQADAVVVVSSYLKTYLFERGIPEKKILVNQNGVNPAVFDTTGLGNVRKQYHIPEGAFVVGYIGGMEPFRRLPEVIGYIAELRSAGNDDVFLLLVGDGEDMPAVQAAIKANPGAVLDAVKLVGWQDHAEVPRFLASFDVAIFPFTNDYCSPLKLFEYLGAGVPTLGPDTSAVREVFEDGVHLSLVKQDGSNFVSTLLKLKAEPRLRDELSRNGKKLVSEQFTWEQNAARVVAHIKDMTDL